MNRGRLVGKSGRVQSLIQPVTTAVASEDPAGAIPAVCGRGEANNQEPSLRIAKAGHRLPPVIPLAITLDLLARDLPAMGNEARTEGEANDPTLKPGKRGGTHKIAGRHCTIYG